MNILYTVKLTRISKYFSSEKPMGNDQECWNWSDEMCPKWWVVQFIQLLYLRGHLYLVNSFLLCINLFSSGYSSILIEQNAYCFKQSLCKNISFCYSRRILFWLFCEFYIINAWKIIFTYFFACPSDLYVNSTRIIFLHYFNIN